MPETPSFYSILRSQHRGKIRDIGVIVYDGPRRELWLRAPTDYSFIDDHEEAEIVSLSVGALAQRAKEDNPLAIIEQLEDTLSNALLISERKPILVPFTPRLLDEIFESVARNSSD